MRARALIDGRPAAAIDLGDRGLHYGDGLFETMAVQAGRIRRLERHLERLEQGCVRLGIASPPRAQLAGEICALAEGEARAVLKLILTRGGGARGYRAGAELEPTRIASLHPWPGERAGEIARGLAVRWCALRLAEQPLLAGLKHLNRLEQVLAAREWTDPDIAEGLLCDQHGRLIGGTRSNVFFVDHERLCTPQLTRCGVAGTVRAAVLEAAQTLGLEVVEADFTPGDLARANEVFLTNALLGVAPVRRLAEFHWEPGPVTRRLQAVLEERQ